MKRLGVPTLAAVAALTLTAGAVPASAVPASASVAQAAATQGDPKAQALLAAANRLLPAAARARRGGVDAMLGPDAAAFQRQVRSAIDPNDYECAPGIVDAYLDRKLAAFTPEDFQVFAELAVLDLPTYEALYLGSDTSADFALTSDGKALTKSFRTLQRFWDIDGSDIDLLAMHGSMLLDAERVSRTYQLVYGVPKASADQLAALVVDYLKAPRFEGGNHPIFTFNAFAFSAQGEDVPGAGPVSDRIVMGDGILRAYRELGYGDVAPQAILAHEYGHHVQYELGMHDGPSSPEATRRTELHADASAAYYLSHPRGESMQTKRVNQFLPVYYAIGDCGFTSDGHHGTPNQRLRAATWAYQLQESARPKGKVIDVVTFRNLFDAALPTLVAPDARRP